MSAVTIGSWFTCLPASLPPSAQYLVCYGRVYNCGRRRRQFSALELLERENEAAGERLQQVVARGELLLQRIQAALHDIAQSQLETQQLLAGQPSDSSQ